MKAVLILVAALCFGFVSQAGGLEFSQVMVISDADGIVTVPANKVWKMIENTNGGNGNITVTGAASKHCGTTCGGSSCSSSSCKYVGYLWELNGAAMDPVEGCHNCGGSSCYTSIANCPANYTFNVSSLPTTKPPYWLSTGHTVKIMPQTYT